MARMICRCGNYLSNHEAPNDIQLRVYTDKEWEEMLDRETIHPWEIPLPKYDVWRCPKCRRIYVFEPGGKPSCMIYKLEEL